MVAPIKGPTQYTAWFLKDPAMVAEPKAHAGFIDPPENGPAAKTPAPATKPTKSMPLGLIGPRLGSLAAYTVNTKTNVRIPSNTDAPNPVISSAMV